jgi:hypothetical protein
LPGILLEAANAVAVRKDKTVVNSAHLFRNRRRDVEKKEVVKKESERQQDHRHNEEISDTDIGFLGYGFSVLLFTAPRQEDRAPPHGARTAGISAGFALCSLFAGP